MESDAPSPEQMVYSFICIFRSTQKETSHEMQGKHKVTVHGAPRRQRAYIQWGEAWFPTGIVYDAAISTPVPCSLRHGTFHLGLGKPELR